MVFLSKIGWRPLQPFHGAHGQAHVPKVFLFSSYPRPLLDNSNPGPLHSNPPPPFFLFFFSPPFLNGPLPPIPGPSRPKAAAPKSPPRRKRGEDLLKTEQERKEERTVPSCAWFDLNRAHSSTNSRKSRWELRIESVAKRETEL